MSFFGIGQAQRGQQQSDVRMTEGGVVRLEVGGYASAENALEFTAIGTAVKAPGDSGGWRTRDDKPFTSVEKRGDAKTVPLTFQVGLDD